LLFKSQLFSF